MAQKQNTCTISIQVSPEIKEKSAWLARQSCRSLSAYVRQLLVVQIRSFEGENGPIPKEKPDVKRP